MKKLISLCLGAAALAALPDAALAESCAANFTITNASPHIATATIYSKTRLNPAWTPKRKIMTREESRSLIGAVSTSATAVAGVASGATAGVATPALVLTAAGGATAAAINKLAYDIRDRRLLERTVRVQPNRTGTASISFPIACRLKREILVDVICKDGQQMTLDERNTPGFALSSRRDYAMTICRGVT